MRSRTPMLVLVLSVLLAACGADDTGPESAHANPTPSSAATARPTRTPAPPDGPTPSSTIPTTVALASPEATPSPVPSQRRGTDAAELGRIYARVAKLLDRPVHVFHQTVRSHHEGESFASMDARELWADVRRDRLREEYKGEMGAIGAKKHRPSWSTSIADGKLEYTLGDDGAVTKVGAKQFGCYGASHAASAVLGCPGPTEESTTTVRRGSHDGRPAVILETIGEYYADGTYDFSRRLYLDPGTYLPFAAEEGEGESYEGPPILRGRTVYEHEWAAAASLPEGFFNPKRIKANRREPQLIALLPTPEPAPRTPPSAKAATAPKSVTVYDEGRVLRLSPGSRGFELLASAAHNFAHRVAERSNDPEAGGFVPELSKTQGLAVELTYPAPGARPKGLGPYARILVALDCVEPAPDYSQSTVVAGDARYYPDAIYNDKGQSERDLEWPELSDPEFDLRQALGLVVLFAQAREGASDRERISRLAQGFFSGIVLSRVYASEPPIAAAYERGARSLLSAELRDMPVPEMFERFGFAPPGQVRGLQDLRRLPGTEWNSSYDEARVEGDTAALAIQTSDGEHIRDVKLTLRRQGGRWLITGIDSAPSPHDDGQGTPPPAESGPTPTHAP